MSARTGLIERKDVRVPVNAAQADAFYTEVLREGLVWGIKDADGFPAPEGDEGVRAMPFWSLRSRAEQVIATVPAYEAFQPEAITVDVWRSRWLPGLAKDGLRVGLNWSGSYATGYDVEPDAVERNLSAREPEST
jgi:hypothetical protein